MKQSILLALLLAFISNQAFSQLQPSNFAMSSEISQKILKKSKKIMRILGFCERKYLKKDEKVVYYINPSIDNLQAQFQYRIEDGVYIADGNENKYYKKSRICFSPILDNVLSGLKDTTETAYLF